MADIEDLNLTVGFGRPCTEPLADSVDEYQGHLFLCTGVSESAWPAKIEQVSPLMAQLSSLLKKNRDVLGKIKLSATELPPSAVGAASDCALYFAAGQSVVLAGLSGAADQSQQAASPSTQAESHATNHAALLHYLLHRALPATAHTLTVHALSYSHVLFVCAHVKVDARCAYCGPKLHQLLTEQVAQRQLSHQVLLAKTSHIGGHKYAGNVLCFPDGRWYGYVTPEHVPALLDHVLNNTPFTALLRGQMQCK